MTSNIRREMDGLGEIDVSADKLCEARTQCSLKHFCIGKGLILREMIVAYVTLKKVGDQAQELKDSGLTKQPLSIAIVISRMESSGRSPVEPRETVLHVGSLELDLIDRTAKRGSRHIDLRPREFQLLRYMMQRSDQLLTRADLFNDVWNYKFVPQTNLVDVHLGRLRRKVDEPNEVPMIRTVRGNGFVLSTTPQISKNLLGLWELKQRADSTEF